MMDKNKAYQFFIRAKLLKNEIEYEKCELEAMREFSISNQYGGIGDNVMQSGRNNCSKVEFSVVKIMLFENKISEKIKKYSEIRFEIEQVIDALNNLNERAVLKLRYLYYKRFDEIVIMTGYSRTQVFRFHRNGLNHAVIAEA